VFLDNRGNKLPVSSYGSDSGFLVFGHEATVAFGISTEDGGELTFEVLGGHVKIFFNVKDGKLTNAVSLSLAWAVQA
jgi:threonine dehydratase